MTECTDTQCTGQAEFALWMDKGSGFSRVPAAPIDSEHEAGDLNPHVCEDCLTRYEVKYQNIGEFRRIDDDA